MFYLNLIWAHKRELLLLSLAAIVSPCAQAGSVSAEFVLDGKTFKPAEVAAFHVRQPSDVRKFVTYVMLTAEPVNADKVKSSLDPLRSLDQDPAALGDHLGLWILSDGTIEVGAHVGGDAFTGEAYPVGGAGGAGGVTRGGRG
jgi:hypothetical protein